jgi:hypothetical protein
MSNTARRADGIRCRLGNAVLGDVRQLRCSIQPQALSASIRFATVLMCELRAANRISGLAIQGLRDQYPKLEDALGATHHEERAP